MKKKEIYFVIKLYPKGKGFKPHIWKEGGLFNSKKSAEFQAKQIKKMKDMYSKVEVVQM
jgi:hypothetical protein